MPPTIKAGNLEKYAVNLQDETNKKHIYFLNDPTPKSRKQEDNLNFLCRGKSIFNGKIHKFMAESNKSRIERDISFNNSVFRMAKETPWP